MSRNTDDATPEATGKPEQPATLAEVAKAMVARAINQFIIDREVSERDNTVSARRLAGTALMGVRVPKDVMTALWAAVVADPRYIGRSENGAIQLRLELDPKYQVSPSDFAIIAGRAMGTPEQCSEAWRKAYGYAWALCGNLSPGQVFRIENAEAILRRQNVVLNADDYRLLLEYLSAEPFFQNLPDGSFRVTSTAARLKDRLDSRRQIMNLKLNVDVVLARMAREKPDSVIARADVIKALGAEPRAVHVPLYQLVEMWRYVEQSPLATPVMGGRRVMLHTPSEEVVVAVADTATAVDATVPDQTLNQKLKAAGIRTHQTPALHRQDPRNRH